MRGTLALMLISAAGPVAVSAQVVELDAEAQKRAGVVVRPVVEESFADEQRVVGQVVRAPGSTITVKSAVAGRVESITVAPGERAVVGQVLVNLHSHDLLAMQGELLRAQESLRMAETRLEAGHELYAIDGIARLDLQAREQEVLSARLDYQAASEELTDLGMPGEVVERILESKETDPHLPVIAPVDSVVLDLNVQEHEWVQAYEQLLVLGDPQRVELELQMPPDRARSVVAGDRVEFVPVGRAGVKGRAVVITRVPQVDPLTRTLRIRARIVEGLEAVFPGVFVEGNLTHGKARRAATVTESAVINVAGEDAVFVRLDATTFEARPVELGRLDGEAYEVLSGVVLGEEVAVEGVFLLKSAMVKGHGEEE